jgi:hypothetical protein
MFDAGQIRLRGEIIPSLLSSFRGNPRSPPFRTLTSTEALDSLANRLRPREKTREHYWLQAILYRPTSRHRSP